jgi:hypothetical protein
MKYGIGCRDDAIQQQINSSIVSDSRTTYCSKHIGLVYVLLVVLLFLRAFVLDKSGSKILLGTHPDNSLMSLAEQLTRDMQGGACGPCMPSMPENVMLCL